MSYFTYSAVLVIAFFTNYSEAFAQKFLFDQGQRESQSQRGVDANPLEEISASTVTALLGSNGKICYKKEYVFTTTTTTVMEGDCEGYFSSVTADSRQSYFSITNIDGVGVSASQTLCRGGREDCAKLLTQSGHPTAITNSGSTLRSDSRGFLPTASQPQAAWQLDLLNGGKRPSAEIPNVPDRSKEVLPTASQRPQAAWQLDLLNSGKRSPAEIPNVPDNRRVVYSSVPGTPVVGTRTPVVGTRTPVVGTLVQYQPQQQHSHRPNPYKSNNHKHHHDNSGWKVVSGCKTYRHNNYYYRNIYGYCW